MTMQTRFAALTIFIGSFLVFGVQPMVGNTLLPFFGGTAAVWTVCLAAFQTLLLAGYFYAHVAARNKTKIIPHIVLLIIAATWVGFVGFKYATIAEWAGTFATPSVGALLAVVVLVGVPYVLLSANASLVQAIAASSTQNDRSIYKLYAVSNIGSFFGLLAYPLVVEPHLTISSQWMSFAVGIMIYTICISLLSRAVRTIRSSENGEVCCTQGDKKGAASNSDWVKWLLLSAFSCFLLNGVSTHLCNDITPLPLMWAVLLALYLLSWTIGFTDRGAKFGPLAGLIAVGAAGFAGWHILKISGTDFFLELGAGSVIILLGGWTIHARLFHLRPDESQLTRYYLMIAIGGAIGGTVASLVFPAVFNSVMEYPAALSLLLFPTAYEVHGWLKRLDARNNGALHIVPTLDWRILAVVCVAFFVYVCHRGARSDGNVLLQVRNFYGTERVIREHMRVVGGRDFDANAFEHGGTRHGLQPIEYYFRSNPTMYFAAHAGGLSIHSHPKYASTNTPLRVALAGMGIGTLAAHARPGDYFRYYEINPQVADIASNTNFFWYVSECKGKLDIVVDDARRALEKERAHNEEKWDVIIIDVFSGDSIPPHMATKEAFKLYLDRLAPGGIISMHITNWHLSLSPMVKAVAKEFNLHLQGYGCWADRWSIGSYWVFLTREQADFFIEGKHGKVDFATVEDLPIMTDDKHSLLPYISMNPMPEFK